MEFTENKIQQIIREKLSLQVHNITENTKGIDQDVWIIETNEQKIVLKYPKNNNKVRNNREAIACKLLADKGVIIPRILYIEDKILIESFLEGTLVDQVDFSKVCRYDLYFKTGQVLKKIHSIATTNYGMVTNNDLVGKYSTQLEYIQAGFSEELINLEKTSFYSQSDIKKVKQYFKSNKSVITNSPSVLLHADYSDSNLVYTPEGEIGVIDFGDLSVGNPMVDITKVYIDHIGDGAFQACIDGYGEIQLNQVKLFALCWLTWLIPALWKRNDSQERVKRLCHVFESIWR